MSQVYSTEELIEILASERQACIKGERLNLKAKASGNPAIDCLLNVEGLQKFTAYQDFKATVHRYQRERQVSGIVWRHLQVKGKTLHYPVVHEQLIALSRDLEILKAHQAEVLAFWQEVTLGMELYLTVASGKDYRPIAPGEVEGLARRTEWVYLWKWEKSDFLEMVLQLGWGKPSEASYRRGWPASGSEYVHAVKPGARPICGR
ncbi:MAG: hypothetical protein GDA56_26125 [Hormoscilla sp. GM7CHS1pb]|nr:hypothetical protein [Hormoscilla sp. GM7CHS1pb]